MDSVIQAQLRARSDIDAIISGFIKNTQVAHIISAELKERKCIGEQSKPVRPSDEVLESAWVSARNSLDATACDTLLSSFFGNKRDVLTPPQLKELLSDIPVTNVLDATLGYGSSLLFTTAMGVKSYAGVGHDPALAYFFADYKTFLERVNGFNTHIALLYRDPRLLDMSAYTYDCALLLNPQEILSVTDDSSATAEDAANCGKIQLAETIWSNLQNEGALVISCAPEQMTYLTNSWGRPTRALTLNSGAIVVGVFVKRMCHQIEIDYN
jgi:hypothetical protein